MKAIDLLSYYLPERLLDYFDITQVNTSNNQYLIDIEEKNLPPEQYKKSKFQSKGFYEPIKVQDFPIRGKACYLRIKRRRWTNLDTGDIVSRDWELVAKVTRTTSDFATFLKGGILLRTKI